MVTTRTASWTPTVKHLHALDPESQVGGGVGGVFFSRKDIVELSEKDLIESFTKRSGRGGQKLNKTNSCVHLLHLPTGTRVACQFRSRPLQANRHRARSTMKLRLEELLLDAASRTAIKAKRVRKRRTGIAGGERRKTTAKERRRKQEGEPVDGTDGARMRRLQPRLLLHPPNQRSLCLVV